MEPVPEQDLRFGDPGSPPTPWADVARVLDSAGLFWISTVRSDGRPHVTPWSGGAGQVRDEARLQVLFEVVPAKVLAFAKGRFAQTRYRFPTGG